MGPKNVNVIKTNVIGVDSGLKNKSLFNPMNTANQHVVDFKSLVLKDLEQVFKFQIYHRRY